MTIKLDHALSGYAADGKIDDVKHLIVEGASPRAKDSWALRSAALNGHLEIVKLLLPISDPKDNDSCALRCASMNSHLEIVKLLLPVSNPKARNSDALRWAANNGCLEIVKLLLPQSDPQLILADFHFQRSPGCDLLLACLPADFVKRFMADNPGLDLPRARAVLASQHLSTRKTTVKSANLRRARS